MKISKIKPPQQGFFDSKKVILAQPAQDDATDLNELCLKLISNKRKDLLNSRKIDETCSPIDKNKIKTGEQTL